MSKAAPTPVALIGCGAVAEMFYVPALRVLEEENRVKVQALVDPNATRAAALHRCFAQSRVLTSLEELRAVESGLAIVASPPRFHADQTVAALRAGWDVLCEKPMAAAGAEAQRMIDVSRETRRLLAVGLFRRFFPAVHALRDMIASEFMGRLMSFDGREGGAFGWPAVSSSFFKRSETPGGVLYDLGVHLLDLLIHWLGYPEQVQYEDDAMGGQEANAVLDLRFKGGIHGTVGISRDWSAPNRYAFKFEKGEVVWRPGQANQLELVRPGAWSGGMRLEERLWNGGSIPAQNYHQSFVEQVRNILAARAGVEPLRVPGEEAIQSLWLVEQCYASRKLMTMPWFSAEEQAGAAEMARLQETGKK